jgi:hypothetical protein
MKRLLAALLVAGVAVVATTPGILAMLPGGDSCGAAQAVPMDESFTRAEEMRSSYIANPIREMPGEALNGSWAVKNPDLRAVSAVPPDGYGEVLAVEITDDPGVQSFFATSEIGEKDTIIDFFARGGIAVRQYRARGIDASVVVAEIGKRATLVGVGPYSAALVHADEIAPGLRPFHIYWSDGDSDWAIVGNVEQAVVIDMARSVACHGS